MGEYGNQIVIVVLAAIITAQIFLVVALLDERAKLRGKIKSLTSRIDILRDSIRKASK